MDYENKGKINDYRVNFHNGDKIISIEVTCCGRHIGEVHFKDGENKKCPVCGTLHALQLQHNHFHIRQFRAEQIETEDKSLNDHYNVSVMGTYKSISECLG